MPGDISAVAVFTLDATQVSEQVAATSAALQGLEATTTSAGAAISGMAPLTFELGTAFDQLTKKQQTAADAAVGYEQAEARLAVSQGDYASAARILSTVLEEGVASASKLAAVETQLEGVHTRAAAAAVQEAQAEARLAAAQGDRIGAIGILQSAEQNIVGITERQTLALETQAAQFAKGTLSAEGFGVAGASAFTSMLGPMALITVGLGAVTGAVGAVNQAFSEGLQNVAILQDEQRVIDSIAGSQAKGNAITQQAIQYGHQYGFTTLDVESATLKLIPALHTHQTSMEQLLSVTARYANLHPGMTFTEAAQAIARIDSGKLKTLATDMQLTREQQKLFNLEVANGKEPIQILDDLLNKMGQTETSLAGRMDGYAGSQRALTQAHQDFDTALGHLVSGPMTSFSNFMAGGITVIGEWTNAITQAGGGAILFQGALDLLSGNLAGAGAEIAQGIQLLQGHAGASQTATVATAGHTSATQTDTSATGDASQATQDETDKLIAETTAKQKSTIAAQDLARMQQTIAGLASQVAAGLISDANAATALANQYGIAANAARDLINMQAQLAHTQAVTAAHATGVPEGYLGAALGVARPEDAQANVQRLKEAQTAADNLVKARQSQILTTGTAAQKEAELSKEMADAARQYGVDSAEYVNAQTKLMKAEEEADKAAKGRKGRAGAGAKLSDQQKLDNSLISQQQATNDRLANAQTADDQKMEKLALEHDRKLSEIDEAYRAKELQAEQDFQQKSLDGRAGFYENLINMQGKQGQKVAREMAAQYEQAVTKSAQIGREKGADAGIAYMDAATVAIEKEGKLKEEINNALYGDGKKGKDKARAEALQGVLTLQQNADNLRLSLVEQSGSKLAQEHSAQIASENERYQNQLADQTTKYADQQQRIQTLSDQAAQRKEDNAVRGKKRVDEETASLAYQNTVLQQNVDLAARSGARPVNPSASPSAVPASLLARGGVADSALLGAVQSLSSQLAAMSGKLDGIIGAEGDAAQSVVSALKSTLQTRVTNLPSSFGRQLT